MISAGGMYPIAFDVLDATGTLTHAATATLTITLPDGTTATPVITDAVTGQYRLAYQTTIPGRYTAHAVTTSPVTSWDDEWDVAATPWPAMVSLSDAKGQLNMDVTDHRFDDELRDFIAAATGAAEQYKHQVIVRRAVTDELDLGSYGYSYSYGYGYAFRQRFRLKSAPVISLTSVTSWDGTTTWDTTQMRVSPTGLVRVMGGIPVTGLVDVLYTAGLAVIPANYKRGALVILAHLWETQRGPGTAASGVIGSEEHWRQPGEFFSVPDKAKELLGPPLPMAA
jgi:hypothetical protein